jgi:hypothetical protein
MGISSLSDVIIDSPTVLIPFSFLSDCRGVVHHQVKLPIHVGKMGSDTLSSILARSVKRMGNVGLLFLLLHLWIDIGFAVQLKNHFRLLQISC